MKVYRLLTIVILLISFSGFFAIATELTLTSDLSLKEQGDVEKVLINYLECRRKGDYKCCSESLTLAYLKRFSMTNRKQYIDFHKDIETHFLDARILRLNKRSDSLVEVTVESDSVEPGVLSRNIELYSLKSVGGSWQIEDIATTESKAIKELGSDGKWRHVNK